MKFPLAIFSLLVTVSSALACDLCPCEFEPLSLDGGLRWHAGIREQYTDMSRLQNSGHGIANPAGQYLHSSITQLIAGYDFTPKFGATLNIPYIHRTFRRAAEGAIESGTESGFGDVSLLGQWSAIQFERGEFKFTARASVGVSFPTGDTSRLREEAEHSDEEEVHVIPAQPEISKTVTRKVPTGEFRFLNNSIIPIVRQVTEKVILRPYQPEQIIHHEHEEEPASGVHGHDLSLGSGSIDGIFGADFRSEFRKVFVDASIQYRLRGNGRHSYDFADDLMWHAGAGATVLDHKVWTAALAVRFSGETKGEDRFGGSRLGDTAVNTVFVGPRLAVTWRNRLNADIGIDFPIRRENSGIQSVPEYRIRSGVNWQF